MIERCGGGVADDHAYWNISISDCRWGIMRYAVILTVSGVSLKAVGLILMMVGLAGLVLSLIYMLAWTPRRTRMARERMVERKP
jgi:uncharacterized membrane protein YuzA (DUF378 family)